MGHYNVKNGVLVFSSCEIITANEGSNPPEPWLSLWSIQLKVIALINVAI